tara:strand:+ start:361 stop:543 length:183 start_codon:yes stop_codon:yes gene_type:complete
MTYFKKYKITLSMGSSSGRFSAILYGDLLKFSKVISFNPQSLISKGKESIFEDFFYTRSI